jgi:hypothetical protein
MTDISKVGLPTFISDFGWDGTSSGAVSSVAHVTSGALHVQVAGGSTSIQPADATVVNAQLLFSGSTGSTSITSLNIAAGASVDLYSISASASAGPCKVELVKQTVSGALITKFFNSSNPSVDFTWPTGFKVEGGMAGDNVSVKITNFTGLQQTAYASIFYHQN